MHHQDVAGWQSGHAADCNSVDAGSIPTSASNLVKLCPSGEIGRHRGFKIPRPQSVPVRVWPRAPFNESNHSNGANKELQHYAGFFMPKKYNIENNNIYVPMI